MKRIICVFAVLFLLLCGCSASKPTQDLVKEEAASATDGTGIDAQRIDDYILVSMENEFSFPETAYTPEYFNADFVSEVQAVTEWKEGGLTDRDAYNLVLKLTLNELGIANSDELIETLTHRNDIKIAEYDYIVGNVLA